eukprot:TRINITY_DN13111_c0_g1_i6.p1 TRINITY_DN13111_c0_g1~~TRINITY_DN13111_c0_g1_i6.p1  ORF type:complete len:219 (+),score=-14.47 TRINITY_DN13111_c0_g1_i6:300-956(+)
MITALTNKPLHRNLCIVQPHLFEPLESDSLRANTIRFVLDFEFSLPKLPSIAMTIQLRLGKMKMKLFIGQIYTWESIFYDVPKILWGRFSNFCFQETQPPNQQYNGIFQKILRLTLITYLSMKLFRKLFVLNTCQNFTEQILVSLHSFENGLLRFDCKIQIQIRNTIFNFGLWKSQQYVCLPKWGGASPDRTSNPNRGRRGKHHTFINTYIPYIHTRV